MLLSDVFFFFGEHHTLAFYGTKSGEMIWIASDDITYHMGQSIQE